MIDDEVSAHTTVTVLAYWKFESVSLQQTVRLSPDFAFVPGKARVLRQCGEEARRHGRQRRARSSNIAPSSGSVSVRRYFSTAMSPMRFATVGDTAKRCWAHAIIGSYIAEVWPNRVRASGMGFSYSVGNLGKIIGPLGLALAMSRFCRPDFATAHLAARQRAASTAAEQRISRRVDRMAAGLTEPRCASEHGVAMGGGRPAERRFTVEAAANPWLGACMVLAYRKFESISLQRREEGLVRGKGAPERRGRRR
jgi:hypothetical protein